MYVMYVLSMFVFEMSLHLLGVYWYKLILHHSSSATNHSSVTPAYPLNPSFE